jgi:glycosyltransferase involved in cell wall biosynthesis
MADEFSKRHDVRFGFAMNCISELHKSPMVNNKPLRFVFSGGLHGGRAEMLKEIGEVIADSNYLVNKLILEVYTSAANVAYYKNLNGNVIRIKEYVPRNQMFQNLSSADVLVHCESFDKNEMEFFEYSMTTKIPEYLSVGRPILCYGPREICSVSYIEDNGVGIVANDRNSLVDAITILCDNDELRNSLGEKALLVAQRDHMSSEVCVRVENIIKSGIELWRNC